MEESAGAEVTLTEAEAQKAKEIFELYDYDGSGTIDMTELRELLLELRLNVSAEFLEDYTATIFSNLDRDKSKKISFQEFEKLYKEVISNQPTGVRKQNTRERINVLDLHNVEAMLRRAFETYDADGSGYLDTPEMIQLLVDLGFPDPHGDGFQSVLSEHMEFADLDADGRVDFHEFVLYSNALLDYLYQMEAEEKASEQNTKKRY
jgi:Ca2+-binding EF-hand superfamily protein